MKTENIQTIIFSFIILSLLFFSIIIAQRLFRQTVTSRHGSARPKMAPIESAIEAYNINTSRMPTKLEDLVDCPIGLENVWNGPYLKQSQLYDPWDREFIYNIYNDSYELISYGADGLPGGEGINADIYND